ncbi:type II toxin-antitoxin system VapC family toxin [Aquisalimonas sp. APHAB1-3]|uniref:type II toxin-antitoxin system VapC family toxin n=1 Tax=Aquisalimonas sp. APHAB1-3 TaxID=3402080 RepID=UPI003AABAFF6
MILIDTNVILDVIQQREPHYRASAAVIDRVVRKRTLAALPAHAITTIHFLVQRYQNQTTASQVVDWILARFDVASVGRTEQIRARSLAWEDFEDAVVAAAAKTVQCEAIVTRNVRDFSGSPVPAFTPEEYLLDGTDRG